MRTLIRQLAGQATVILSTHIMQEVEALCDRVLVLSSGELALDAPLQSLRESRHLILTCSNDNPDLARLLERTPQVTSVEALPADDGQVSLRLGLHEDATMDTAAGNLSRLVIESGARLYRLTPERRDLEQVFREAIQNKGDRYAA